MLGRLLSQYKVNSTEIETGFLSGTDTPIVSQYKVNSTEIETRDREITAEHLADGLSTK